MRLAELPTPLTAAPRLASALGLTSLHVKRDDLTGFAVAGNKARQLELLLDEAAAAGADTLVTGGTTGSNFVQGAAAAAAYAGLGCHLVLAGRRTRPDAHPNLAAAVAWGAQLHWTDDPDRASVDTALVEVARELALRGLRPHVVPRGGATATGATGYRLAVDELLAQLPPSPVAPVVVVATGSGGTLAGLVAGAVASGRPFRVVGASVSRPPEVLRPDVLRLAREVAARRGEPLPSPHDVCLVDARGPGHGLRSAEGDRAADLALRTAGLVLDPVYTAKALAVLPDVVGGSPAVFWHTGGLLDAVAGLLEQHRPDQHRLDQHAGGTA
ncbi:MAG TPA: pyridoxal-phosphate dependent enzyme [Mycobacteriales bacterium]|nr:pyridoxal-phosphate dependent enzyme [Mycobacteriales bacterium]